MNHCTYVLNNNITVDNYHSHSSNLAKADSPFEISKVQGRKN